MDCQRHQADSLLKYDLYCQACAIGQSLMQHVLHNIYCSAQHDQCSLIIHIFWLHGVVGADLRPDIYFDLLHSKMTEYNVQPHNIVNMDEKGFQIGVLSCSKRVFSRELWEKKEVTAALQNGSHKWITLLAAICADEEVLPPGIIYASQNSTLRDTWVAGIKAGKHDVFVGSTPSGWSNNDVGLA
jgi:hypothetical protein